MDTSARRSQRTKIAGGHVGPHRLGLPGSRFVSSSPLSADKTRGFSSGTRILHRGMYGFPPDTGEMKQPGGRHRQRSKEKMISGLRQRKARGFAIPEHVHGMGRSHQRTSLFKSPPTTGWRWKERAQLGSSRIFLVIFFFLRACSHRRCWCSTSEDLVNSIDCMLSKVGRIAPS